MHATQRNGVLVKEFYTTGELASILGNAKFTVRERCCNE
jgi:hypothetical protein